MIDARSDFRNSASGTSWNDVVDSTQFNDAAKAAFVEYCKAKSLEPETAGPLIKGAREYLHVLMHLADTQKPSTMPASSLNLNPTK